MTETVNTPATTSIDPGTQMGFLALSVSDLDRSLHFYTDVFGFQLLKRDGQTATLGAEGTPLLLLREDGGAAGWPRGGRSYTGLYHFAVLTPTRADLGRWLRHWLEMGQPVPGQGDHLVSEALYLEDPDGHGIEVYRDRPRSEWTWDEGRVRMASLPVDIRGLLKDAEATGQEWTGLSAGTRIGHVHLQVADIAQAASFYHDLLGFDIVAQMPSALFISAGGYHHHIGMNTWHSAGAGPAPQGTVKLRYFTVELPTEEARSEVVQRLRDAGLPTSRVGNAVAVADPWKNTILLIVGSAEDGSGAAALEVAYAQRAARG